jgi:hypothetical protein
MSPLSRRVLPIGFLARTQDGALFSYLEKVASKIRIALSLLRVLILPGMRLQCRKIERASLFWPPIGRCSWQHNLHILPRYRLPPVLMAWPQVTKASFAVTAERTHVVASVPVLSFQKASKSISSFLNIVRTSSATLACLSSPNPPGCVDSY